MEIVKISTYDNNEYHDLLEHFRQFKGKINSLIQTLEQNIYSFIENHSKHSTFSIEAFQNIEKEFSIEKLVIELNKITKFENSQFPKKGKYQNFLEKMKQLFHKQFNEIEQYISNYLKTNFLELLLLEDQKRHDKIILENKQQIKREVLSNGRWIIQTLKPVIGMASLKLKVFGSDIIFGIASYNEMIRLNYELQDWAATSYFVRQDGVHYGFGLSEVEQEFGAPEFSCSKNDIISITYHQDGNKMILENLITKEKQEFDIPENLPDWCFIIGLRFQNESVIILSD